MPCDRSFGLVEKKIRRFEGIFTPDDYVDIIQSTHKKFRVVKMQQEEFYNLNSLVKAMTKRKASQGKFSKSSQIVVKDAYKEGFLIKDHYSGIDEDAVKVRLQPGRKSYDFGNFHLENLNMIRKYNQERLLKKSKVNQLKSLLPFYPNPNKRAWLEGLVGRQEQIAHDGRIHAYEEDQSLEDPECNIIDYDSC
ncbi:hypothetical protein E2C01_086613 [Portunus trituberculatus]|uniref:Uncharacterized protein n=1 Tax=Portunus trituberculatus TaxID=210409 RepID=A0A5B7JF36_PORTR|nr:hypothetical protein [Portunus trituberculatus]